MQDNEFEKQVHQKLTGLTVDGGESVWEKVEERLDKKDKRRRWLLWIPVGVAGAFLAAFLFVEYKPAGVKIGKEVHSSSTLATSQPSSSDPSPSNISALNPSLSKKVVPK